MINIEPQLAKDADLAKLPYPNVWGMPKIDGVRGMNMGGIFTGRSLDPFEGFGLTEFFSQPEYFGFDGEITLGPDPMADRLCSLTTGACGAFVDITERADFHWWLFDYLVPETVGLPYEYRYRHLENAISARGLESAPHIHLVPYTVVPNMTCAKLLIEEHLDLKYEGTVFRNYRAPAKGGRPTEKGQEFMRYKLTQDSEMRVSRVEEGETNTNEAKKNTLGRTERSSAKAGKVKRGAIGTLHGYPVEPIYHPLNGKLLFPTTQEITVACGKMTAKERVDWFEDQTQIVSHIVKFTHMPHGVKDKPRHARYISKRLPQDMS